MDNVLQFPQRKPDDGGRTRILARRARQNLAEPFRGDDTDNLVMGHADPEVVEFLKTAQQAPCDVA